MMCKLCELYEQRKLYTRIYGETDKCIVVGSFNNEGSRNPRIMAVLKSHTENPTAEEIDAVMNALKTEADKLKMPYGIECRKDAPHFHIHAVF